MPADSGPPLRRRMLMISVVEPTADCQREIVRALVNLAEGRGTKAGTLLEFELHDDLTEYQWDRCWWNARWWARNEDVTTYELFRLAGKGCPIIVDTDGARILGRRSLSRSGQGVARESGGRPLSVAPTVEPERPSPQRRCRPSLARPGDPLRAERPGLLLLGDPSRRHPLALEGRRVELRRRGG